MPRIQRVGVPDLEIPGDTLESALLAGEYLHHANLEGVIASGANFCFADLRCAMMKRSDFTLATFVGCDAWGCDGRGSTFGSATFAWANLRGAVLTCADLRHADLRNANLTSAELMEANLGGADLSGADLNGANLTECRADAHTKWPIGFNPHIAKVRFDTE